MKLEIKRRVLFLMGTSGLITSLLLGGMICWGLNSAEDTLNKQSKMMALGLSEEATVFAEEQTRKLMEGVVRIKANHIYSLLCEMEGDVLILANKMTEMSKYPVDYTGPMPKDPRFEPVYSGELYYLAGPSTQGAQAAMGRAAHLSESLLLLGKNTPVFPLLFYVGSKEGWSLRMDFLADDHEQINLPASAMLPSYDAKERTWYKLGEKNREKDKPVYVPLYTSAGGAPLLSMAMPYEDKAGVAGVVGISVSSAVIFQMLQSDIVDENEICFALNPQGQIVFSSRKAGVLAPDRPNFDLRQTSDEQLAEAARLMAAGQNGSMVVGVDGEQYYLVFAPIGDRGWSLGELVEVNEIREPAKNIGVVVHREMKAIENSLAPRFNNIKTIALCGFGLFLLVIIPVGIRLAAHFSRPIRTLSEGVSRITAGNFDEKLTISTGDETELLAGQFNNMTRELKQYMEDLTKVTEEQAKVTAGLDIATKMQQGLLPEETIEASQVTVSGSMKTAIEVGGDFYDYYFLDDRHLAITVADVSDKGIPSAIFMVVAKTILKNCLSIYHGEGLGKAVAIANDQLVEVNNEGLFVTVWAGILELDTGQLTYVNAGHNPPVMCKNGEVVTLPKEKNPMLGVMEGIPFRQQSIIMDANDLLFLYTDGVTEAMNDHKEMFTMDRMKQSLLSMEELSPVQCIATIETAVEQFVGAAPRSDDITMVVVKYQGKKGDGIDKA